MSEKEIWEKVEGKGRDFKRAGEKEAQRKKANKIKKEREQECVCVIEIELRSIPFSFSILATRVLFTFFSTSVLFLF